MADFYQESKEQDEKINRLYEDRLKDKDLLIVELKELINLFKK